MSKYAVVNPATGETVKEYPLISDGDLAAAISVAEAAHRNWALTTSVAERAAMVRTCTPALRSTLKAPPLSFSTSQFQALSTPEKTFSQPWLSQRIHTSLFR